MPGDFALHTIEWTETEELRVSVNEYKGRQYFAVRVWFKGRDGEQWFPGKNGINVPLDKVEEFVNAVDKGHTRLHSMAKHGQVDLPREEKREHQGSRKVRKAHPTPDAAGD